jgi:uncharacterized membrane protein YgcG
MIKSATLISAAVTTIVLVTLAGVAYAYKELTTTPPSTPSTSSIALQAVVFPLIASAPTNIPDISPQDAASIAVKFANRTDLYSVELADFNGSQTYKLTFSSGDVIYVAMNGQVVGSAPPSQSVVASPTTQPPPAVIYTGPIKKQATAGGGGDNSSGGGGGGGEHEGGGD